MIFTYISAGTDEHFGGLCPHWAKSVNTYNALDIVHLVKIMSGQTTGINQYCVCV